MSVGAPRGRWGDFGAQRGFPGKAPYRLRLRRSRGGVKVGPHGVSGVCVGQLGMLRARGAALRGVGRGLCP